MCIMLAQSIPILYHIEANACIFFAAGVIPKRQFWNNYSNKDTGLGLWSLDIFLIAFFIKNQDEDMTANQVTISRKVFSTWSNFNENKFKIWLIFMSLLVSNHKVITQKFISPADPSQCMLTFTVLFSYL